MAWLLLLAPLIAALAATVALTGDQAVFTGDNATIEIRVLHALRGEQLVGAYSRYGWGHPGPLYFYLMAPFYAASGHSSLSLSATALLINAAALIWLAGTLSGLARTSLARALVFVMFALFLLAFRADAELIPAPLASIWNPDVAVLPFGVLIVAAALLGSGRRMMFPVVVLVHAFVTQAHVGFVVPATLAAAVGLGCAVVGRHAEPRSTRWGGYGRLWFWSGLAIGALCWTPPLVDLIWGRGNLVDLIEFFATADRATTPWVDALASAAGRLSEPMLPLVDPSTSSNGPLTVARYSTSALLTVGLVVAAWRARRRGACFEFVLATMILVQFSVLVPLLAQLDPTDPRYLSEWVLMLSVLGVVAVAMSLFTAPAKGGRPALVAGATAAILAVALAAQVDRVARRLPAASAWLTPIAADLVRFADAAESHLASETELLLAADESAMSTFAGAVCLLYKRGYDPVMEDTSRVRTLFGSGFEYRASSPTWIVFSATSRADGELLARGQRIWMYRLDPDSGDAVIRRMPGATSLAPSSPRPIGRRTS